MAASAKKRKKLAKGKQAASKAASPAQLPRTPSRTEQIRTGLRFLCPDSVAGHRALIVILVIAFGFRIVALTDWVPIVGDESIYMHWAEIIEHQGEWFISLLDAKPPLHVWLLATCRMVLGGDLLFQARLITVGAGLLSVLGIFGVGRLLGGELAGLIAAGLYAVAPIAVFHDRLAYTESFVNLSGIAVVLASLWAFGVSKGAWRAVIGAGVVLGLGLFTKQSMALFAHAPLLAGLLFGRGLRWGLLTRWAVIYGLAALFVVVTWVAVPAGPDTDWRNPAVHRTDYFVSASRLLENPFGAVAKNWNRVKRGATVYVTWPMLIGAVLSLPYLAWRKPLAALLLAAIGILPLFVQCVLIKGNLYPFRWTFPHLWPLAVMLALAAADVWRRYVYPRGSVAAKKAIALTASLLVAGPMMYRTYGMLREPEPYLREGRFMDARAHAGYGNREAIDFLLAESSKGPFVLLTDPIPGPPGDAMFPYLNHRQGITVYEAWWMKLAYDHPILPPGRADIMKSQYQRVTEGIIDFSRVARVYYVTDTFYHTEAAVRHRQPNAKLVARFEKPFRGEAVEVYRLK